MLLHILSNFLDKLKLLTEKQEMIVSGCFDNINNIRLENGCG